MLGAYTRARTHIHTYTTSNTIFNNCLYPIDRPGRRLVISRTDCCRYMWNIPYSYFIDEIRFDIYIYIYIYIESTLLIVASCNRLPPRTSILLRNYIRSAKKLPMVKTRKQLRRVSARMEHVRIVPRDTIFIFSFNYRGS